MTTKRAILIAGPTASGKSDLALALAEQIGGCVVNADSMQVYEELRVLTARPSIADEARVPHRLYGHVSASQAYSTGRFIADARAVIEAAAASGRVPIFVGGTGLYFKAMLEGLSPIPPIDMAIRAHWRGEADRRGAEALHAELAVRDPAMAQRLDAGDTQRIVRALEVIEQTGRSLASWQQVPGEPLLRPGEALGLVVNRDREEIHARTDARFAAMVAAGAVEEVIALQRLELSPELPAMRAVGVAPLSAYLAGTLTLEAAIAAGQLQTRHYVKKQQTWLRRHMMSWNLINAQQMSTVWPLVCSFMKDG